MCPTQIRLGQIACGHGVNQCLGPADAVLSGITAPCRGTCSPPLASSCSLGRAEAAPQNSSAALPVTSLQAVSNTLVLLVQACICPTQIRLGQIACGHRVNQCLGPADAVLSGITAPFRGTCSPPLASSCSLGRAEAAPQNSSAALPVMSLQAVSNTLVLLVQACICPTQIRLGHIASGHRVNQCLGPADAVLSGTTAPCRGTCSPPLASSCSLGRAEAAPQTSSVALPVMSLQAGSNMLVPLSASMHLSISDRT